MLIWKKDSRRFVQGELLCAGPRVVGSVYYDGMVSRENANKYVGVCSLSKKQAHFPSSEEAKYWVAKIALHVIDALYVDAHSEVQDEGQG